jgi:hypothetical protein
MQLKGALYEQGLRLLGEHRRYASPGLRDGLDRLRAFVEAHAARRGGSVTIDFR